MHNSPAEAMLACLNPWICFYPFSPFTHLCKKIEHVILFYLFNRIVLCLERLWFDIKGNILYKWKVHYFTLNWCFLFVCLLDCSLDFLIDWFIDWLAKKEVKLKLHVFWWWETAWFSLVLLYLRISTRIPKSSRVKECSLAVFPAVSRKLSSDNFQILSMSELFANSVISSIININW